MNTCLVRENFVRQSCKRISLYKGLSGVGPSNEDYHELCLLETIHGRKSKLEGKLWHELRCGFEFFRVEIECNTVCLPHPRGMYLDLGWRKHMHIDRCFPQFRASLGRACSYKLWLHTQWSSSKPEVSFFVTTSAKRALVLLNTLEYLRIGHTSTL